MSTLSGIYAIMCIVDKKILGVYVGQSKDLKKRFVVHRTLLNQRRHSNNKLIECYNKYGLNSLHFMVMEVCSEQQLHLKELYWYNELAIYYPIFNSIAVPTATPLLEKKKSRKPRLGNRGNPYYTSELIASIRNLRKQGKTTKQISQVYNIPKGTVCAILYGPQYKNK